jgi:hypothetical protein
MLSVVPGLHHAACMQLAAHVIDGADYVLLNGQGCPVPAGFVDCAHWVRSLALCRLGTSCADGLPLGRTELVTNRFQAISFSHNVSFWIR